MSTQRLAPNVSGITRQQQWFRLPFKHHQFLLVVDFVYSTSEWIAEYE